MKHFSDWILLAYLCKSNVQQWILSWQLWHWQLNWMIWDVAKYIQIFLNKYCFVLVADITPKLRLLVDIYIGKFIKKTVLLGRLLEPNMLFYKLFHLFVFTEQWIWCWQWWSWRTVSRMSKIKMDNMLCVWF